MEQEKLDNTQQDALKMVHDENEYQQLKNAYIRISYLLEHFRQGVTKDLLTPSWAHAKDNLKKWRLDYEQQRLQADIPNVAEGTQSLRRTGTGDHTPSEENPASVS